MATVYSWPIPTNLRNNATPVDPTDAATKAYVDASTTTPGGANTNIQYNANGVLGGSANLTFDGSNIVVAGKVTATGITSTGALSLSAGGNINVGNTVINNLATPVVGTDASNKNYVDAVAQGLQVLTPCLYATTQPLPGFNYDNGASGVGATITADLPGALVVDGATPEVGDRVLVKDEVPLTGEDYANGIYVVTTVGDGATVFVLTRAADQNQAAEFYGAYTFIQSGTVNALSGWICTASDTSPIVVGTDGIFFNQFSQAGQITAGAGLSLTGSQLDVVTDGITLGVDENNQVFVLDQARFSQPDIGVATGTNLSLTNNLTVGGDLSISGAVYANGITSYDDISTTGNLVASDIGTTGNVVAGVVQTFEITGSDLVISTTGLNANLSLLAAGDIDVNSTRIMNLLDPVDDQDAATKAYVDASGGSSYGNANVAAYLATNTGRITAPAQNVADNSSNVATTQFVQSVVTAVGGYGNAQVAQYLPTYIGNIATVNITGNLTAPTAANGTNNTTVATTAFVQAAVTGAGGYSNLNVQTYLPFYSGNIGNSVGLTVTGNLSATTPSNSTNTTQVATTAFVQNVFANSGGSNYGNANVTLYLNNNANVNPMGNASAVAVGRGAGGNNTSGVGVSIGFLAGRDTANADDAVAIGSFAASTGQNSDAIAIGFQSGGVNQGAYAVAIGSSAGNNSQGGNSVSIGIAAGQTNQGTNAVAIGIQAGQNTQGNNAVAIGYRAGVNSQAANSIVINASGANLTSTTQGFYVAPVRNDNANTSNAVYFNTTTNELTWGPAGSGASYGNANVAAYLPTYTGNINSNVLFNSRQIVSLTPNTSGTGNTTVYTSSVGVTAFQMALKAVVNSTSIQMLDVLAARDSTGNIAYTIYSTVNTNSSVTDIVAAVGASGSQLQLYVTAPANTVYTYQVTEFN